MRSNLLLAFVLVVGLAACGSDSKPPVGKTCTLNSECNNPLSCTYGKCHEACRQSGDCPAGQTCVKGPIDPATTKPVNICQLPEDRTCAYHSDCKAPLKCARDLHCRNECVTDVDCNVGQTCVTAERVCADPPDLVAGMLKGTIDGSVPQVRPGVEAGVPGGGPDGGVPPTGDGGGSSDVAVTPTGDGGGSTTDVPVTPAGDGPMSTTPIPVTGVMVDKPIMRQGETGAIATVTAPSGLSNATNVEIGDCRGTVQAGGTDTMFSVRITCVHGVALGPKDLKFQTTAGVGTYPAVLTVSAITASPAGKDDARGTSSEPFRTFKKALSVADSGDTIELKDGTYDKDGGEDFVALLPPKLTIIGQSAAGTKLIGPSDTSIRVDGIRLRDGGDLTVKNISFGFFEQGIYLDKPANLTLENVKVTRSRGQGVYVYSGADGSKINWTGDESEISDNGYQAVQISSKNVTFNYKSKGTISSTYSQVFIVSADDATVNIEGTTLTSNMMMPTAQALSFYNGANSMHSIVLTNVTVNGQIDIGGKDKSVATITGSTFNLPTTASGNHIGFTGGKLTLSKSTFNGGATVLQIYSGETTVRETKFRAYNYYGVQVHTAKKLDLGNKDQPGANDFDPNPAYGSSYAIYDQRAADMVPITVSETTLSGNLILSGMYEGPGAKGPPKSFYIQIPLNTIIVF